MIAVSCMWDAIQSNIAMVSPVRYSISAEEHEVPTASRAYLLRSSHSPIEGFLKNEHIKCRKLYFVILWLKIIRSTKNQPDWLGPFAPKQFLQHNRSEGARRGCAGDAEKLLRTHEPMHAPMPFSHVIMRMLKPRHAATQKTARMRTHHATLFNISEQ